MNRQKAIDIVRALQQKTVGNGCTEAEAEVAFRKAAEIMAKHGLSNADVLGDGVGAGSRRAPGHRRSGTNRHGVKNVYWHPSVFCYPSIASYCRTKFWRTPQDLSVTFFGSTVDVELSFWLASVIKESMDASWKVYLAAGGKQKHKHMFLKAMAIRVSERLDELTAARPVDHEHSSQIDLMYNTYLEKTGLVMRKTNTRATRPSPDSVKAVVSGLSAGSTVRIFRETRAAEKLLLTA